MSKKPFVVCAVHELSRHATQAAAEAEMEQYEATGEITYVIVNTGGRDAGATREPGKKPTAKDARGHGAHGRGARAAGASGRAGSRKRK